MCYALVARVRLLLSKGHSCYRPRRTGERKRKSVRGCIVDANLSVLALMIVKKGEGVSVLCSILVLIILSLSNILLESNI